jgi:hypothetical protein
MPDSVDSPAPLKIATLPMVKASTNIPNEFGLLSIATAFTSSPDAMAIVCQKLRQKRNSEIAVKPIQCRIAPLR